MTTFSDMMQNKAATVSRFLDAYFAPTGQQLPHAQARLREAMRYSLLQEGKRFRPTLAMLVAEALGHSPERVLPFAAAVECIHTYSLIHDDLPVMDNDDYRRGLPTNHKVYGDATALLAGDALLTEAFRMLARAYHHEPTIATQLVFLLSEASGFDGMVGGQEIDLNSKKVSVTLDELEVMHRLKTGALISVAAVGAAHLCFATETQLEQIKVYSQNLGLAFQVADDILDFIPDKPEPGSYPALMGIEQTKVYLNELTAQLLESISGWSALANPLRELAQYNLQRKK